jgi:phosphohistidine swiveling domain-containing protein
MTTWPINSPKWIGDESSELSRLTRERLHSLIRKRVEQFGSQAWTEIVNQKTLNFLSVEDGRRLGTEITNDFIEKSGRLLFTASEIGFLERSDIYQFRPTQISSEIADERLEDNGIGSGDNVFRSDDVEGNVMIVRHVADVNRLMVEGVPEGTIAVIDDAGGTLTAPIFPEFDGVLCRAGSIESHLAIIAREYGVPTLMNVNLHGELRSGDRVRVSFSSAAQTSESSRGGSPGIRASIWRLES